MSSSTSLFHRIVWWTNVVVGGKSLGFDQKKHSCWWFTDSQIVLFQGLKSCSCHILDAASVMLFGSDRNLMSASENTNTTKQPIARCYGLLDMLLNTTNHWESDWAQTNEVNTKCGPDLWPAGVPEIRCWRLQQYPITMLKVFQSIHSLSIPTYRVGIHPTYHRHNVHFSWSNCCTRSKILCYSDHRRRSLLVVFTAFPADLCQLLFF